MASLIKSISLTNFKGFSEEVRIDLRPITLLFGANSAGKSTILQSLQLVREVLEHGSPDVDSTLQGGKAVDLGGFRNFVHRHETGRVIEIGFGMELGDESLPELAGDAFEDLSLADAEVWRFHETLNSIRASVSTLEVKLSMSWSDLRNEAVVSTYKLGFNNIWCAEISTGADGRQPRLRMNANHPIFLADDIEGEALFHELADWVLPGQGTEGFRTELGLTADDNGGEKDPEIPPSVLLAVLEIVRAASADSPNPGFAAWLHRFKGAIPELDRQILIPANSPESAKDIFVLQAFSGFMSWMLVGPLRLLSEQLEKSRYLGPLRCIPPRGFEASLSRNDAAWSDGMAAWETLLSSPQEMLERCSHWMQHADRLNSGYGLVRTEVQEIDYNTRTPLGRAKPRIALVDQAGLTHQALDVGVGISQVLPVVVAAQDDRASIVSIEQPELHVHPAVQVGLGDLFIDGAIERGLSFLLETHSEHLVLRLLRRIKETTEGSLPDGASAVTPDDVNIVYLEKGQDGGVIAHSIGVDANGKFNDRWPRGFFPERMREALPPEVRRRMEAGKAGSVS
ncbi:MAG: DUF3696 domain-containing protein [Azonexus sp.]|nr:DUF3696 domain-containing protein [Azonexus sp.]